MEGKGVNEAAKRRTDDQRGKRGGSCRAVPCRADHCSSVSV